MSEFKTIEYGSAGLNVGDLSEIRSFEESGSESVDGEQNGSRKRKRPMNVTCEACKQRKVKCDRAQPACGWCIKNDHVCEYKERKKPGLRAGYGRELEGRLDQLESIIQEQGRQLAAHLRETCSGVTTTSNMATDLSTHRRLDNHDTNPVADPSSVGPAGHVQMIDPTLQTPGSRHPSLNYHTGTTHDHISGQPQGYRTPSINSHSILSPHSTTTFQQVPASFPESNVPLPPYDLLYALVDLYFRHVNVWLPLLDRKSTLDTLFGPNALTEADRVLLHAIVATSLRFSQDPRLTSENRLHYHTISKQKVQLFGMENTNVRSLQALVILALDVTGTTNGPPGWNLLSLISRGVVQLGLAAESTSSLTMPMYPSIATLRAVVLSEPKSYIEDEERRRLFWAIYLLDRYATVATAFDFALDEKEIDRRLPCRDDLFSSNRPVQTRWFHEKDRTHFSAGMPDTHGHFAYHCELLCILGRIHMFLKRPVNIGSLADVEQWQGSYRALDSELNAWHFSLPDEFVSITRLLKTNTSIKSPSCGWLMLHAAYYLTVMRLNSSAAFPSQTSPVFSSSYSAMQRCLSAIDNARRLAQYVKMSGLLDRMGVPFAFMLWVSARLTLVHGSTTDVDIDPDVELSISLLVEMGQYWDVAQRYSEILKRVLEEYQTSQRSDAGERVTPSTVKILADMRRCAFDLDVLISRQLSTAVKSYYTTRANSPAPNELEYLDVFDLFNFPRIPATVENADQQTLVQGPGMASGSVGDGTSMTGAMVMPNFALPNPDTDWLFHTT